jgi:hypothetical protein
MTEWHQAVSECGDTSARESAITFSMVRKSTLSQLLPDYGKYYISRQKYLKQPIRLKHFLNELKMYLQYGKYIDRMRNSDDFYNNWNELYELL